MSLIPKVMTKLPETGDLDTPGRGGSGAGGPGGQAGGSGSPAENLGQRATTCDCPPFQGGRIGRIAHWAWEQSQKNAPEKSAAAKKEPPVWFREVIAVATHCDRVNSWPRWQRLGHWLLVSWRCPCCKKAQWNKKTWRVTL